MVSEPTDCCNAEDDGISKNKRHSNSIVLDISQSSFMISSQSRRAPIAGAI